MCRKFRTCCMVNFPDSALHASSRRRSRHKLAHNLQNACVDHRTESCGGRRAAQRLCCNSHERLQSCSDCVLRRQCGERCCTWANCYCFAPQTTRLVAGARPEALYSRRDGWISSSFEQNPPEHVAREPNRGRVRDRSLLAALVHATMPPSPAENGLE